MSTSSEFRLSVAHEWVAHDPFGKIKPADESAATKPITDAKGQVILLAARNGYVSFRLLVEGAGEYRVSGSSRQGLEVDLFKAWYHKMRVNEGEAAAYWPDALVPFKRSVVHQLPDPDNRIEGQTIQEFWVDVFVPADAKPGTAKAQIKLKTGQETVSLPVRVKVLDQVIPNEPCVVMDFNSYGCRWLPGMFPKAFAKARSGKRYWQKTIELLHHYYRLVHEHRGLLHNLGYGHSGTYDLIYGPQVKGAGRSRTLTGWEPFDEHYGPLLDGSAFTSAAPGNPRPRRPAKPIWGVYTTINPDFPADYLWWGQKGYETEFTRGVAEYDTHFREKGWTESNVEFFFNHKKRYRWYEWDGDEPKYAKDMDHHKEMIRMWESVIDGSPVKWVYRMDASWQMKNQFDQLGGHKNFWVCAGFHRWYPEKLKEVTERGEITWWYNGTPPVQGRSSGVLALPYETWIRGLHGNCQWQTVSPGPDPWFDCTGANTGSVYPGERFGIPGPIPSTRMKILRNGVQDIDLLNQKIESNGSADRVRAELGERVAIPVWVKPPRAAIELPPEDWDGNNLSEDHEPDHKEKKELDAFWWTEIRDRALVQEATS